MKLALIADWLPVYGGAEHVISAFVSLWPDSPLFTTVANRRKLGPLSRADIRTDRFLQTLFRLSGRHQLLLPLMPRAIERIDLTGYDVVLSSSHAVGKGIVPPPGAFHVCYCHTPMRYAWEMEDEYLKDFGIRWPLSRFVKSELKKLRRWDLSTAKRVDHFIANSTETQRRIERIYGRDSIVIPPPVEAKFYDAPPAKDHQSRGYFLAIGRLVPYKRFDLLIELANRRNFTLKIGGTGTDLARLKKMADPTVEFLGHVADADLPSLFAGAEALLFPQIEDAGIVPVEAQACGTPVIALGKGGVLDVVDDGRTGLFVKAQTVEAFEDAIERFRSMHWDPLAIRKHAEKFHEDEFKRKIEQEIRQKSI